MLNRVTASPSSALILDLSCCVFFAGCRKAVDSKQNTHTIGFKTFDLGEFLNPAQVCCKKLQNTVSAPRCKDIYLHNSKSPRRKFWQSTGNESDLRRKDWKSGFCTFCLSVQKILLNKIQSSQTFPKSRLGAILEWLQFDIPAQNHFVSDS